MNSMEITQIILEIPMPLWITNHYPRIKSMYLFQWKVISLELWQTFTVDIDYIQNLCFKRVVKECFMTGIPKCIIYF